MNNVRESLFKILAISILLLSVSSCWEKGKPEPGTDDKTIIQEPSGILKPEEARQNYERYQERRIAIIRQYEDSIDRSKKEYQEQNQLDKNKNGSKTVNDGTEAFIPAEFVSFDYEDIREYLRFIEQEAKLSGEEITSLRVYFSNNPERAKYSDDTEVKHPRQTSIMLSPTITRDSKEFIFFTSDVGTENERTAQLLTDDFIVINGQSEKEQKGKSKASMVPLDLASSSAKSPSVFFASRSLTYNRGSGSPPNNNN